MADYSQVPPRSPVQEGGPHYDPYASYNQHQQFQESGPPQMTHSYPPGTSNVPYTDEPLQPPMAGFHGDPNRASVASSSGWNSRASLQEERGLIPGAVAPGGSTLPYGGAQGGYGSSSALYKNEPDTGYNPAAYAAPTKSRRPKWLVPVIIAAVVLIAIAGGIAAYFLTRKKDDTSAASSNNGSSQNNSGSNGSNGSTGSNPSKPAVLLGGADGSQITLDDGTKFTYTNSFGGSWYYDPDHPLELATWL